MLRVQAESELVQSSHEYRTSGAGPRDKKFLEGSGAAHPSCSAGTGPTGVAQVAFLCQQQGSLLRFLPVAPKVQLRLSQATEAEGGGRLLPDLTGRDRLAFQEGNL